MTFGPLDEPAKLGPSEFDDGDLGWAGDLGISKGRILPAHEEASLLRREANAAMDRAYAERLRVLVELIRRVEAESRQTVRGGARHFCHRHAPGRTYRCVE
jgi:hypothetical protein